MAKFLAILSLLLGWSFPSSTIARENIISLIEDKQYWESFEWDKTENSPIWIFQGWKEFIGKQDDNKNYVKEGTFSLLGIDFTGYQILHNAPAKNPWILSFSSIKTSVAQCEEIVAWGTSKFGMPNALDTSYEIAFGSIPEAQLQFVEKIHEWIVGSTSITVSCGGTVPKITRQESAPAFATVLSFTHQANNKPVSPLFALKCNGKMTVLADASTHALDPFTFLVDTHWGKVRNLRKVPLGKQCSVTPEAISFTLETNDMDVDYRIDRMTGQVFGEARYRKNQKKVMRLSGECEKVTATGPKF